MRKMLKDILIICAIVSSSSLSSCSLFGGTNADLSLPTSPYEISSKKLVFAPRTSQRWQLPNGLVVHYIPDYEVPMVRATLSFPGGSLYDPAGLSGLASATGSLMREGSVDGFAPDVLDSFLDKRAASIESSFGEETGSVGVSALSEDFVEIFSIFSRIVREPAFDSSRLSLWKKLTTDGIRQRNDDPETMASMAFEKLVYGARSAQAQFATLESIAKITREDIISFRKKFVAPNSSILSISGAISEQEVRDLVEEYFGTWEQNFEPLPRVPPVTEKIIPGIYLLEKDFDQARILIGHRGPKRFTPDYYDLIMFNEIFGSSGFKSTLFSTIRTKLGLAYSVYGSVVPGTEIGSFIIYAGTRASQSLKAIRSILELVEVASKNEPAEDQFRDAISAIKHSFVFKFSSFSSVVSRRANQELLQFPKDYDRKYLERIENVTKEGVVQAVRNRININDLVIVIVGKVSAAEVVKEFGSDKAIYQLSFDTEPRVVKQLSTPN